MGTLSPAQAVTTGGLVNAVLTTGGAAGVANLTASAGAISGGTSVGISCGTTPLILANPPIIGNPGIPVPGGLPQGVIVQPGANPAPPPVTAPQVSGDVPGIRPPSTGDAGLLLTNHRGD
jgi:hypothetical protein